MNTSNHESEASCSRGPGLARAREESGTPSNAREDDKSRPREIGGRKGPDPVRYGDWEKNGRCIDF